MTITPIYAGLLAFLCVLLSVRVIGRRREAKIGLGDGADRTLVRRMRAHGNFSEYVPLTLLLMAFAELQSQPGLLVHTIGVLLVVGRLTHAIGFGFEPERAALRVVGTSTTLTAILIGALANLQIGLLSAAGM